MWRTIADTLGHIGDTVAAQLSLAESKRRRRQTDTAAIVVTAETLCLLQDADISLFRVDSLTVLHETMDFGLHKRMAAGNYEDLAEMAAGSCGKCCLLTLHRWHDDQHRGQHMRRLHGSQCTKHDKVGGGDIRYGSNSTASQLCSHTRQLLFGSLLRRRYQANRAGDSWRKGWLRSVRRVAFWQSRCRAHATRGIRLIKR